MKWINGEEISSQMIGGEMVETMWLNGEIIWQGIRSCYGSGAWLNSRPYTDNDGWKN
jgi:hypothetical protein